MKATIFILAMMILAPSALAENWERVCVLPGQDVLGKEVGIHVINLYRRPAGGGKWNYRVEANVNVSTYHCKVPGQHPEAHIEIGVYGTKNKYFGSGRQKRYGGNKTVSQDFTNEIYVECIDVDWSYDYKCKF